MSGLYLYLYHYLKHLSGLYLYLYHYLKHLSGLYLYLCLYLITRLTNLTLLPVFSDEALYMEWGWRAIHSPGQLWHALADAKQPFLMWLFGLGQTIFTDPLFGARLVSVFTGLLSVLGLYAIGKKYFSDRVAFLSAFIYIILPSFVFFDRQALMESSLVCVSVWSLYFLLSLFSEPKLKTSIFLGLTLGLGFFIKNSALLFFLTAMGIITLLYLRQKKLFYVFSLSQISISISFLLVNLLLFFQPLYWSTLDTNSRWTFTLSEILKFPFSQWLTNIVGNLELAFVHLTPPLFIFLIIGVYQLIRSKKSSDKIIILWFLLPFVPYLLTEKFMNSMIWRYQTPLLAVTPIIIAFALSKLTKPVLIGLCLSLSLSLSLVLIVSPISFFRLQSTITRYSYIEGYLTGTDTGYQVNEIVKYLKSQAAARPIYIGIAVHSFNPESGIWAYFRKTPNAIPSYFDSRLIDPQALTKVDCLNADRPLYFVAKLDDTAGLDKYLDRVTVITNPYNSDYSTIYTLKKSCIGTTLNLNLETPINY